ncbi:MAG TPA: outer membrane beta-barrel family protein [Ignavibacteriales bacterium]|nr:outer membrane beta-barrel family protein [Ignavibacteriales bacterium]
MKLKAVILLLLFISGTAAFGQKVSEKFKLTGSVADESSGKGLLSATISILNRSDNKTLSGSTSDEKGNFTVEDIPQRHVRVRLSMLGYQTVMIDSVDLNETSRLGLIKLKSSAYVMPEVVIKSLKPMIEVQADRQILNIDRLPGSSGTLTDALKNSGLVDVDPQSNKISVRGQDVKIQMDGHEYNMPSDMLAQLPASMIDQAEVILAPGAKESAEGGTYILNLISKKNTFDNYSGSISFNTSSNKSTGGGLNLNYKADKLNIFAQGFGSYFAYRSKNETERFTYGSKSLYHQLSSGRSDGSGFFGYGKLGFDYDFNEKNSMTIYGSYNPSKFSYKDNSDFSVMNPQELFQYGYDRQGQNENSYNTLSFYGFYKKKFEMKGNELTFDLMYTSIDNPADNDMSLDYSTRPGFPQKQNSTTGVNAQTVIFKTDYVLPIKSSRLEAGYSFTFRNRQNDYDVLNYSYNFSDWRDSLSLSNDFRYKERINALYTSLSYKIDKFDIKGGLRAENLNTDGNQITSSTTFSENFLNLFPNLSMSYRFSDLFNLGFNTFRRVTYPQIYYINPFRQYQGPNSYFAGNPKLQPYYVNSYAVNLSQYVNVFYVYSTGYYASATATENDSVMIQSFINLNNGKTFGVDLTLPYYNTPMMPFHLPDFITMLNIQFHFLSRKQTGQYIQENLSMTENSYNMNANLGLKLWYDINMNLSLYYRPSTTNRIAYSSDRKYLGIYFSKTFLDRKLRLNLSISDPLEWQKGIYKSIGQSYYSRSQYESLDSRRISLGISYMFNDFKDRRDRNLDDGRDGSGGQNSMN